MHTEQHANDTVKAIVSGVTSAIIATATLTGLDPDTILYISGLITTGATAAISAFYVIRRLTQGAPAQS